MCEAVLLNVSILLCLLSPGWPSAGESSHMNPVLLMVSLVYFSMKLFKTNKHRQKHQNCSSSGWMWSIYSLLRLIKLFFPQFIFKQVYKHVIFTNVQGSPNSLSVAIVVGRRHSNGCSTNIYSLQGRPLQVNPHEPTIPMRESWQTV